MEPVDDEHPTWAQLIKVGRKARYLESSWRINVGWNSVSILSATLEATRAASAIVQILIRMYGSRSKRYFWRGDHTGDPYSSLGKTIELYNHKYVSGSLVTKQRNRELTGMPENLVIRCMWSEKSRSALIQTPKSRVTSSHGISWLNFESIVTRRNRQLTYQSTGKFSHRWRYASAMTVSRDSMTLCDVPSNSVARPGGSRRCALWWKKPKQRIPESRSSRRSSRTSELWRTIKKCCRSDCELLRIPTVMRGTSSFQGGIFAFQKFRSRKNSSVWDRQSSCGSGTFCFPFFRDGRPRKMETGCVFPYLVTFPMNNVTTPFVPKSTGWFKFDAMMPSFFSWPSHIFRTLSQT